MLSSGHLEALSDFVERDARFPVQTVVRPKTSEYMISGLYGNNIKVRCMPYGAFPDGIKVVKFTFR
jgi:hypothetical protein